MVSRALQNPAIKRCHVGVVGIGRLRQRDRHRQQVLGIEWRLQTAHHKHDADQQATEAQERHGKTDLGNHQVLTQPMRTAGPGTSPAFLEGFVEVQLGAVERRRQTKQERRQQTEEQREAKNPRVQMQRAGRTH